MLISLSVSSKDTGKLIRSIFDEALSDNSAHANLEYLCKNTKGRINGSPAAAKAVEFTRHA